MKSRFQSALLAATALIALPAQAFAQDSNPAADTAAGEPEAADEAAAGSSADAAPSAAGSEQTGLTDIIVTAEKRSTTLQKTPAAVTAVSGDELSAKGISNVLQLNAILPSVRLNSENTNTKLFVRGVGSDFGLPYVSESVSTYVNGGLVQRFGAVGSLFDIESVQVLPGPQGTLYGRNSVAGTIQITTKRPAFEVEGDALLEYGNYDLIHGAAAVSVPASDTLAFRFATNFQHRGAYQSAGTDTEGSYAGRISALWEPSEKFTAFVWGQFWENRFRSAAWQNLPYPDPEDPWFVPAVKPSFFGQPGQVTRQPLSEASTRSVGAEFSYEFGDGITLTYIPLWMKFRSDEKRPVDGFDLPWKLEIEHHMHELRLAGDAGDGLQWLVGANYMSSKGFLDWTFGPNLGGYVGDVDQENYSVYGQGTIEAFEGVRLTAGGRYSWDSLSAPEAQIVSTDFFTSGAFNRILTPFTFDKSWKKFDWKVAFEADIGPRSMLYGNVQTGHNQGTYNTLSIPGFDNSVDMQTLLGFTGGVKNRFFDSRLEINVEGFYYRYKDFLLAVFDANIGNAVNVNADRAIIKGVQIDSKFQLTDNDLLTANVGLLDAKIDKFVDVNGTDYSGFRLPNAPTYTVHLGYEHKFDLSAGDNIVFRADTLISDGYWGVWSHDPFTRQDAYSKTDVSLTYYAANGNWDIGIWGRNLENSDTLAAAGTGGIPGPAASYIDAPRTYGVKLHANF